MEKSLINRSARAVRLNRVNCSCSCEVYDAREYNRSIRGWQSSFISGHAVGGYAWRKHTRDTRTSLGSPQPAATNPAEMNETTMPRSLSFPFLFVQSYTSYICDAVSAPYYRRMFYMLQTDPKVHVRGNWVINRSSFAQSEIYISCVCAL